MGTEKPRTTMMLGISIKFPTADEMADIFRDAGLANVRYELLGFGTVALHVGVKA